MADIAVISGIMTSIKAATDIAKLIRAGDVSLEKAEINLKLAELIGALADIKMELAEVQELIIEKDRIISKLQALDDIKHKIKYEGSSYWIIENDTKDGPYCQQCYDSDRKLIRLQDYSDSQWQCNKCKNHAWKSTRHRDDTYR